MLTSTYYKIGGSMYWNDWYAGWGWLLWYGILLLLISSIGNWGYTYKAHRRYEDKHPGKNAMYLLDKRYANGDIKREEYLRIKSDILDKMEKGVDEVPT